MSMNKTRQCSFCSKLANKGNICIDCSRKRAKRYRRRLKKDNKLQYRAQNILTSLRKYGVSVHSSIEIKKRIRSIHSCSICLKQISYLDISVDHIIPISRGGSPNNWSNIQFICLSCNLIKGNLLPHEFEKLREFLRKNPEVAIIVERRLKASGFMYRR